MQQVARYVFKINGNEIERRKNIYIHLTWDRHGRLKRVWHVVRCWAQFWRDRLLRMSTENAEVMLGWHDYVTAAHNQISPSPLLAVIHPSAPVSLFFCLGQCYTLLRSRFSPAFVTSLALLSLMIPSLPVLSHDSTTLSILKNLTLSLSHLPIFMLSPTHTLIQYSYFRGHLWAPFSVQMHTHLHFLLRPSPSQPLLFLIKLIQILVLVSRCSSFFRLKAMCRSLLLSLCLFLHLFLPPPPTQSLSPLPTPFSLLPLDVIVCAPQIACVCLCIHDDAFMCLCVRLATYVVCQPVCGMLPHTIYECVFHRMRSYSDFINSPHATLYCSHSTVAFLGEHQIDVLPRTSTEQLSDHGCGLQILESIHVCSEGDADKQHLSDNQY